MARKKRWRNCPRAGRSRLSSVSASSSRYISSTGRRGGTRVPELGISGINLTSTYPRGVWGSILKLFYRRSGQPRDHWYWVLVGSQTTEPPTGRGILVQNYEKNEAKQGAFKCFYCLCNKTTQA